MLHHTWLTYYRFKTLEVHVSTIEFRVHIEHEDYIAQALSVAWIQNQVPTNSNSTTLGNLTFLVSWSSNLLR